MKNTYQLSQNKDILIIVSESGEITAVRVADIDKRRDSAIASKDLNIEQFDAQIEEYEKQIAFVSENI